MFLEPTSTNKWGYSFLLTETDGALTHDIPIMSQTCYLLHHNAPAYFTLKLRPYINYTYVAVFIEYKRNTHVDLKSQYQKYPEKIENKKYSSLVTHYSNVEISKMNNTKSSSY